MAVIVGTQLVVSTAPLPVGGELKVTPPFRASITPLLTTAPPKFRTLPFNARAVPLFATVPRNVSVPQAATTCAPGSTETVPLTVPQPVRMLPLAISRPLPNQCVPPIRLNVAALLPLPTMNRCVLVTTVPPLLSAPPINASRLLAPLVNTRLLAWTEPLEMVICPIPLPLPITKLVLAAITCPPLTQTVPVDWGALPTFRPALTLRVPPPTVNIPPGPPLVPTTIVE